MSLSMVDSQIAKAIEAETQRQRNALLMIASENYTSQAVLEAQASVLTNKYAEGYPGRRYYGGCEYVDIVLTKTDLTGLDAENALERAGINTNKNSIPFDKRRPKVTSGIRLGTPAITTRGMKEREMKNIAEWITRVLENPYDEKVLKDVRSMVHSLCRQFPLHY